MIIDIGRKIWPQIKQLTIKILPIGIRESYTGNKTPSILKIGTITTAIPITSKLSLTTCVASQIPPCITVLTTFSIPAYTLLTVQKLGEELLVTEFKSKALKSTLNFQLAKTPPVFLLTALITQQKWQKKMIVKLRAIELKTLRNPGLGPSSSLISKTKRSSPRTLRTQILLPLRLATGQFKQKCVTNTSTSKIWSLRSLL